MPFAAARLAAARLAVALALGLAAAAAAAPAAAQERTDALWEVLGMGELLAIMRDEGLSYGADLGADLLGDRGGAAWTATVEAVYDVARMEETLRGDLGAALSDAEIGEVVAFFTTPEGERIVGLELSARRAMLDDDVEDTASLGWRELRAEGGPRWDLLTRFAEVNDLIESNVAGALTANYAFYMGLVDGNAFDAPLPEQELLADVWGQEPDVREDTVDWVYSFTSLAYRPLSDDEFAAYVEFADSPGGQALNAALFTAFNELFTGISRDLGLGAARFLAGEDI